jgi:hypothetical protein
MALALRRFGKRGYTRTDLIQSGPQAGTLVIFESNEVDRIVVMQSPPSGTTVAYDVGDPEYDWWDNNVNFVGDFEMGAELDVPRTKLTTVIIWLEYWLWPQMLEIDNRMVIAGWTNPQRIRGLGASLASWDVPLAQAQSIATNWVNSSQKPAYGDLGLAELPHWVLDLAGVFAYPGLDIKT